VPDALATGALVHPKTKERYAAIKETPIEELKDLRLELSSVDECIAKRLDGIIANLEIPRNTNVLQCEIETLKLFGAAIHCIPAVQN